MQYGLLSFSFCKFRIKKREEQENIRYKENMQKKMDMLLKLKSDITSNRVIIQI